ncbi:MAG: class I SAM-dependent methyltransferase [Cytophagales bacterium]|nr:class I SAM-dependent methyltransferase [Cytophagales bacterium]
MKDFWNERFGQEDFIYGKSPNAFFAEHLSKLGKGKVLLPAEGEGRNAVYAAKKGWKVVAFDFSEEGKSKAIKLAKENNVRIEYHLLNASDFRSNDPYDVIALIFAHFAGEERKVLFKKLENALAPGGHLLIEVFSKNQLGKSSGGPKDFGLLYSADEIKSLFPNIRFSLLSEYTVQLKEGRYHLGEASVIRALGTKNG